MHIINVVDVLHVKLGLDSGVDCSCSPASSPGLAF